jgi:hypothetical protein
MNGAKRPFLLTDRVAENAKLRQSQQRIPQGGIVRIRDKDLAQQTATRTTSACEFER